MVRIGTFSGISGKRGKSITPAHERSTDESHEREQAGKEPDRGSTGQETTAPARRRPSPFSHILNDISIPDELKPLLPRRWKRLGNAVVLKLSSELLGHKEEVGKTYARSLAADTVFRSTSPISEEFRKPSVERIYGSSNEVTAIENHIKYSFDITRIMFSKGNTPERARVCRMDMLGEKVLDMFAGIGYFTLPAAVHGKARSVVAMEKNPVAYRFLTRNIVLNHCGDVVCPVHGDNRKLTIDTDFDRVFMGYLLKTEDFLTLGVGALAEKGGIIHFHTNIERGEHRKLRELEEITLEDLPGGLPTTLESCLTEHHLTLTRAELFRVKSYAPSVYHVVFDLYCEP